MKLSELKTGEKGVIVKVSGHGSFRKRIVEMGFVKGKTVKVVLNAPFSDPIEYEIIGYKISLRREEASMIEVISESEAEKVVSSDLPPIDPSSSDLTMIQERLKKMAIDRGRTIKVALVGNPNSGKTSLFNMASGSHEHVGNYSGVTVDAKEGRIDYNGYRFIFVDLPGTYSLSAYSAEELYVRKNLIEEIPDVVINVVDATNLERNMYLTTQLIDMNLRLVMALNMYDEFEHNGDRLDIDTLAQLLGVPIVPTVSRSGKGVDKLLDMIIKLYNGDKDTPAHHIHINHGSELEQSIDVLKHLIQKNENIRYKYSTRFLAIKYLEGDSDIEKVVEQLENRDEIIAARFTEQQRLKDILHVAAEPALVDAKYAFIQGALKETYKQNQVKSAHKNLTDRIDSIVTNRWLSFPIFLAILFVVFWATFDIGQYPMDWIEALVGMFSDFVASYMPEGIVKDLVVDGIIAGVGGVIVFLPNILILYLFISFLEDTGYMSRAAFIMDKLMHKMGLHGKSFIPMIMGFGCNVPAIMATRSIESPKSRLLTMLAVPFMSCSGRIPIYVIFASAFFPKHATLVIIGLYFFGILLSVMVSKVLGYFIKGEDIPFVMELPPYRVPTAKSVMIHTWEKAKEYLKKMAGIILVFSVIVWFLGYFPNHDKYDTVKEQQEHSYIGYIGKAIEPVMEPLGFDWKMSVGIITGVAAKEIVLSSLSVLYASEEEVSDVPVAAGNDVEAVEAVDSAQESEDMAFRAALLKNITPAAALSYMIFILIYLPCLATFVAIKNESGGWKWAIINALYSTGIAWILSFFVYRLFNLFL